MDTRVAREGRTKCVIPLVPAPGRPSARVEGVVSYRGMSFLARFDHRKRGALLAALAFVVIPGQARAEAPLPVTAEQQEAATRVFEEGEHAYRAGDFSRAAERFEEAYQKAPHPAPLWNAARAWEKAGEPARAANGYARYLREAEADALDRDEAGKALAQLSTRLGRLEVFAPEAEDVRIDDQPLEGTSVYVHPGTHLLEGRVRGVSVKRTEVLEAGSVRSVALVAPIVVETPAEAPKPVAQGRTEAPRPLVKARKKPLDPRPWLTPALVVSGAATLASAGIVVWSGLDTLAARRDFDAAPTADKLDVGQDKQTRTNVLLGVTLGLGAITGALGSFWLVGRGANEVAFSFVPPVLGGPAFVAATGSF